MSSIAKGLVMISLLQTHTYSHIGTGIYRYHRRHAVFAIPLKVGVQYYFPPFRFIFCSEHTSPFIDDDLLS